MTFEEFFTKKKIDLKALKAADELLFEEFKAHYSAMGEKSFDHSKKFWFNKLRKSFHLTEEEVVVVKKTIQEDKIETTSSTTDANASKPAGFKPRFKAPAPSEPSNQKEEPKTEPSTTPSEATDSAVTEIPKPAGFKPRFKAGVTKAESTDSTQAATPPTTAVRAEPTAESDQLIPSAAVESNAATTASEGQTDNLAEHITGEASKPAGFKPRFKPGITKSGITTGNTSTPPAASTESTPTEATAGSTSEPSKPTGFKPRFKAGVTKTGSPDSTQAVTPPTTAVRAEPTAEPVPQAAPTITEGSTTNPTGEPQQNDDTVQEQAAANKPKGFKPRFKAGLTKIDKKEE